MKNSRSVRQLQLHFPKASVLSRVRGSVSNNNGIWIGLWLTNSLTTELTHEWTLLNWTLRLAVYRQSVLATSPLRITTSNFNSNWTLVVIVLMSPNRGSSTTECPLVVMDTRFSEPLSSNGPFRLLGFMSQYLTDVHNSGSIELHFIKVKLSL
jgi:hypothetical protein